MDFSSLAYTCLFCNNKLYNQGFDSQAKAISRRDSFCIRNGGLFAERKFFNMEFFFSELWINVGFRCFADFRQGVSQVQVFLVCICLLCGFFESLFWNALHVWCHFGGSNWISSWIVICFCRRKIQLGNQGYEKTKNKKMTIFKKIVSKNQLKLIMLNLCHRVS